METRPLLDAELLATWRTLNERMRKHLVLSAFILVSVTGLTMVLVRGVLYAMESDFDPGIERREAVLILFGILLSRSIIYTYNRFLKSRELQYVISSPLTEAEMVRNRLLLNGILLSTLFLLALGLIWAAVAVAGLSGLGPGTLGPGLLTEMLVFLIMALIIGFSIPIKLQVRPLRRTLTLLLPEMYIGVLLYFVTGLSGNAMEPKPFYLILLALLLVIALEALLLAIPLVATSWVRHSSKMGASGPMEAPENLTIAGRRIWGRKHSAMLAKELKIAIREREFVGNLLVTVSIAALLVITFAFFPMQIVTPEDAKRPPPDVWDEMTDEERDEWEEDRADRMERQKYIYPLLVGFAIFINSLLLGALSSLAMVGVEGKALWNLKSLPLRGGEVMWAKAMAVFLVAWPVIMGTALAIPLMGRFPLEVVVFLFVEANAFLLAFVGIGTYGAASYPNFDQMGRGMPDLLIQILMVIVAFAVAVFIGGIPALLLNWDYLIGMISAMAALLWGILIFRKGISAAARRYDLIDAEAYRSGV